MNFELSSEALSIGDEFSKLVSDLDPVAGSRNVIEGRQPYDAQLWRALGQFGWLGVDVSEGRGGAQLGMEPACVIAEKLGQRLAAVPYSTAIGVLFPLLELAELEAAGAKYMAGMLSGELVGSFVDLGRAPTAARERARLDGHLVVLDNLPVPGGAYADVLFLALRSSATQPARLVTVDLRSADVARHAVPSTDPAFGPALLTLSARIDAPDANVSVDAETLGRLAARKEVLVAFEQLGGASECLELARAYAIERKAFGRPIGSFQAIKHKLARMFVFNELARSNSYYALWAAASGAEKLPAAAAAARLSATRAYAFAARESMAVFGGMGITFEADSHLFLRRSKCIEQFGGNTWEWGERLMEAVLPELSEAA